MSRLISIADAKMRDAQVELVSPNRKSAIRFRHRESGLSLKLERLIKTTDKSAFETLSASFKEPGELAKALIESDPEIDIEQVGRRLEHATRVWVDPKGNVLYTARALQVVTGPDGTEKSRTEFVDVEATVGEELPPLLWSGRLMATDHVVRRFAFVRKVQLRHTNGLTFDFLYEMASHLEREGKLLMVGAGAKSQLPLVFQTNGAPFRGFLEGRVDGERYRLVLHLSNLELRGVTQSNAGPE